MQTTQLRESSAYRAALKAFQRCSELNTAEFVSRNALDNILNVEIPRAVERARDHMTRCNAGTCTAEELAQLKRLAGFHLS